MWCEREVWHDERGGRTRTSRMTFVLGVEGIEGKVWVVEEVGAGDRRRRGMRRRT